jgi:2-haloacid dehalogenase/putative hydrolase of the HAD superfamily
MPKLRGIMLDFYGTLVHEDDISIAAITALIHEHAPRAVTPSEIGRFWYESFFGWCNRSYGEAFITQRELALESLSETLREFEVELNVEDVIAPQFGHWIAPPLFPDTVDFLAHVKTLGLPMWVVSNVDRAEVEEAIAHHHFSFDGLVTSEDVRAYKPRPEMFHQALDAMSLGSGEVLHIGDSHSNDVVGATNLGIPVAWLNRTAKSIVGGHRADYVSVDLSEVRGLVDRLV